MHAQFQTILQGTVEGKRRRGRPRVTWTLRDTIKTWTNMPFCQLLETAKDRQKWKDLVYNLAHHMRPYDLLGLDSVMGQLLESRS